MRDGDDMLHGGAPADAGCACADVCTDGGAATAEEVAPVSSVPPAVSIPAGPADHPAAEVETQVARAQTLADAEEAARRAEETAAYRAKEAAHAERRAEEAVEQLGSGAGFVTRAGVYYDVRAAKHAALTAVEAADAAADAARVARALEADKTSLQANLKASSQDAPTSYATSETSTSTNTSSIPAVPLDSELVADDSAEEGAYVDDAAFARQVARLTETVARQPLHREILYKTLVFCEESRPLRQIEEQVASYPEFAHAANNPYHFVQTLEQAGGLERFDLDEEGEVVTPERKADLTEDEVDDLVVDYAFMTTPAGLAVVEQHTPRARIIELLGLVPERKDTYVELLDFCAEEPRTYNEICQLLRGRPALVRLVDGEPQTMQPSVFVDKMEAAGGMEWVDGGWVLTPEGRDYLAELRG